MDNLLKDIAKRRKAYSIAFFVHSCELYRKVIIPGTTKQGQLRRQKYKVLEKCAFSDRPSRELRDFNPEHVLRTGGYYLEYPVNETISEEDMIKWGGKFYTVRSGIEDTVASLANVVLIDVIPPGEVEEII